MGNKAVEAFKARAVSTSPCDGKYHLGSDQYIAQKDTKIIAKNGKDWGSTEYFDATTNEMLFKTNYKTTGFGKQVLWFFDVNNNKILTLKCKQAITKNDECNVYRPNKATYQDQQPEKILEDEELYLVAQIETKTGMTQNSSICKFIEGPEDMTEVYSAGKISAMKFFATMENSASKFTLVKAQEGPMSLSGNCMEIEVPSGTDLLAAIIMINSVMPGGGGSAGALAGAGVT